MRKRVNRTMSAALLTGGLLVATAGFAQAVPLPDLQDEIRVGDLVSVPVNICGNTLDVLSKSQSTCESKPSPRTTADKALVSAPVNVCGNAVGVAGGGNASCGDTQPEEPSGIIEAPVNVCGTSAAVLGTATGDCPKTDVPEEPQPEEPQPEEPQPEDPEAPETPGGDAPGGGNNGGNNGGNQGGDQGDDSGAGRPSDNSGRTSANAAPIPNLAKTGSDPLEFLLAGFGLMAAGAMAHRGARRRENA